MQTPVPPDNAGQRPNLLVRSFYLFPHHVDWLERQASQEWKLTRSEVLRRLLDQSIAEDSSQPKG